MADYVSDTFPHGTDLFEVSAVRVAFIFYNYTDVVQAILDAKLRKIFAQDHRIRCAVEEIGEDTVLISVYFPERQYRTKRAKPVYENLAGRGHLTRPIAVMGKPPVDQFVDVSEVGKLLRISLWPVAAYQQYPHDVSHARFFKNLKTGPKPWTKKGKKRSTW